MVDVFCMFYTVLRRAGVVVGVRVAPFLSIVIESNRSALLRTGGSRRSLQTEVRQGSKRDVHRFLCKFTSPLTEYIMSV